MGARNDMKQPALGETRNLAEVPGLAWNAHRIDGRFHSIIPRNLRDLVFIDALLKYYLLRLTIIWQQIHRYSLD